jgi:hypothetical protein
MVTHQKVVDRLASPSITLQTFLNRLPIAPKRRWPDTSGKPRIGYAISAIEMSSSAEKNFDIQIWR